MKILGSDFDGTFTEGGITEEKIAAVAAWRRAGHKFGIISGRGGDFLPIFRRRYPDLAIDFFAACNGAYITDGEGNLMYEAPCRAVSALSLGEALYDISRVVSVKVGEHCLYALKEGDALPEWVVAEERIPFSSLASLDRFHCYSVCFTSPDEAIAAARARAAKEGILCGISSGTNVAAAIRLAKKLGKGKRVVTVLPDTAERYFSTPLFAD